ncbi:hypothetical protein AKJ41_02405 [candidate division MSBL1 archaeon SCGC-AAA259O05]|uniref:Uncharacterized protein n=1 Tax=candidate division MSBL1 archaeon SCGC-AAA259O05 TaxID=1698271 RepID=A0A133V420_9EURY|nr:hypothetical protein AKJ41_02405 [candidate division MSBL1 archaeon SCGC-AAA259O05]
MKITGLEEGRAEEVWESAGEIVRGGDVKNTGYIHALEGIVSGLDSDRGQTLPRKIAEGKYTKEELEETKEQMERRSSQEFRPEGERSFYKAWSDILLPLIEKGEGSE